MTGHVQDQSKRALLLALTIVLSGGVGACGEAGREAEESGPRSPDALLVLRDVTLVDPATGETTEGRTVSIADGRIVGVGPTGPADEVGLPDGARVVDGAGRYLVPGLADMHVHFSTDTLALGVLLAHGVTHARIMSGTPEALALREGVEAGDIHGPELSVAGPLLAGEEVPWPHELVRTPEEARAAAEAHVDAGYDYLKVYDGLAAGAYEEIARISDSTGLPLIGHVPAEVGIEGVLEAGQGSIEHVEQLLYARHGRDRVMTLPPEQAAAIAEAFAGVDVFVVPTLAGMERLMRRGTSWTAEQFDRPAMAWVNPDLLEWWASVDGLAPDSARLATRLNFMAIQEALTLALHEYGVTIMAGTDTPYPLLIPGLALHEEIRQYVDLGMSSAAALATATVAPARFLGREGALGIVAEGADAELVLLRGNPLEDPAALGGIEGVVRDGVYLDRAALDGLLEAASRGYGTAPAQRDTTEMTAGLR